MYGDARSSYKTIKVSDPFALRRLTFVYVFNSLRGRIRMSYFGKCHSHTLG